MFILKQFLIEAGQIGYVIVEAPIFIVDGLELYDDKFNDWAGEQDCFRLEDEFGDIGLSFGYSDMIDWLNNEILVNSEEKARVIKEDFYKLNRKEKELSIMVI